MEGNKATSIGNQGTQNIQGDYGEQAKNSGTQHQPNFAFSQTAPATAQMPTTAPAPAPAPAPTSGTQNIQSDNGKQANNSGIQHQPNFAFSQTAPAPTSGTQNIRHRKHANNSGTQYHPTFTF